MSEPFGKRNRPAVTEPPRAKRALHRAPAPKPDGRRLLYVLAGIGLVAVSVLALFA